MFLSPDLMTASVGTATASLLMTGLSVTFAYISGLSLKPGLSTSSLTRTVRVLGSMNG